MLKFGIILAALAVFHVQAERQYRLYTLENRQAPVNMSRTDSHLPKEFKLENHTIILIHGHGGGVGHEFNVMTMRELFEFQGAFNVIVVDWENEARHSYSTAVSYVPSVANELSEFIRWLVDHGCADSEEPETTTNTTPTTTPTTTTTIPTTTMTTTPTTTTPTTTSTTTTTTPITITPTTTTTTPTTTTPTTTTTTTTTTTPTTTTTTTISTTTTTRLPLSPIPPENDLPSLRTTICPGVDVSKLHLVGFGLGAHIAGIASRQLRLSLGVVGRITGLDPSGDSWGSNSQRLRVTDAHYVEVIHTDGSGPTANGIGTSLGHKDFFANGGSNQPGCFSHSCSHDRAYELFAASMQGHLQGTPCSTSIQMSLNLCRGTQVTAGGTDLTKPGYDTYFRLNTGRRFPF